MSTEFFDTRISVAETHISFIEKELIDNKNEHLAIIDSINQMKGTVGKVEIHLGKQNGILPRLEKMVEQQAEDQQEIKTCIARMHTKNKVIWSASSALAGAALAIFIKMVVL